MDYETLIQRLGEYNEEELFYQCYYYARQKKRTLQEFLLSLDKEDVLQRRLLVEEWPETIPSRFEDDFFYDLSGKPGVALRRQNRYTPAITHSHGFFEISYVYSGKCTHRLEGQTISMRTGDILFIPPGVRHSLSLFGDGIVINIMLCEDAIHSLFHSFLRTENALSNFFLSNIYAKQALSYILFQTGQDVSFQKSFVQMLWEYESRKKYYCQCICNALLIDFFFLVRDYRDTIIIPDYIARTDTQRYDLIRYIQENYQNVSIKDIAEEFYFAPEYISRLIRDTTGKTYTQILLQVRMEKARELLQNTSLPVSAIADRVGYQSPELFNRNFKKYTGMTPTEFRRRCAEESDK